MTTGDIIKKECALVLALLFLAQASGLRAGVTLIQSFTERNTSGGNSHFGWTVSDAGDVNNDGYDDVIVGAEGYNSSTGRAYIYFGSSLIDNTADVVLTGEKKENYFGRYLSEAGDVNNDGYDDVIVGAPFFDSDHGRAYVYFGGSPMDNTADVIITSGIPNYLGCSVSTAGDVNKDGYDDIIIGLNKLIV